MSDSAPADRPPVFPAAPAPAPTASPRPTSAVPVRRRHVSHRARAVALASSVAATGALSFAMSTASHATSGGTVSGLTGGTAATVPAAGSDSGSSFGSGSGSSSGSGSGSTATTGYVDGTYTGSLVTNRYGPVEVQATITDGKLSAVALVQSPSDRKSQRINAQAAPVLEREAIAAQSSTLDVVSGATYTSQSYATSLQSALDQAAASVDTPIATGSR